MDDLNSDRITSVSDALEAVAANNTCGVVDARGSRNQFESDERGANLMEYALLLMLIAAVCVVSVAYIGQTACVPFSGIGSSLQVGNSAA